MKFLKTLLLLVVLTLGVLLGAYLYNGGRLDFLRGESSRVSVPIEQPEENAASLPQPMPPRYLVEPPKKEASTEVPPEPVLPLPTILDEADDYLKLRLPELIAERKLLLLLSLDHFIQKLVLLIDQLPEKNINRQHLPVNPPAPGFLVSGDENPVISAKNAARYGAYVRLAEAVPDAVLLKLYRGLYPLFQKAYQEMGNPERYFNDRLIEVIDHLLETPEPKGPIALVPHVQRYKFADEKLEALSAGQKILLRMGTENAQRIKQKLKGLRDALVTPAETI